MEYERFCCTCLANFEIDRGFMVKVKTTNGLLLELKFSSVLSTAVPVSGLILVLQRSVGSSPHLSLVSPVLSTVKHRLPVEPKIRFRVERPSFTFKSHDPSLH